MKTSRLDQARLIALLVIIGGLLYFNFNIFAPRLIPKTLRLGTIRRPITLLVLGTDLTFDAITNRQLTNTAGRTDSILLLRFDPVRYKVNVLSIPRDSFVTIPGYGQNKINAANVFGGINLVKETIKELTGKDVDYFLEINPYAAVELVDLMGGIKLDIDTDMYYVDRAQKLNIDLKAGRQKLKGKDVEGYLRFRHDALGDLGRIERQQKFLQALSATLARPANLLKAPMAIGIANKYIKTDLPLNKTIRLANFLRMLSPRDIRTFTASGEPASSPYAGSILIPNKQDLEKIIGQYF